MKHDGIASNTRSDGALIAPIVAPTLILAGDGDAFMPLPLSKALAAAVPDATMDVMEGCGHVMICERPAEFNQRVRRFLAAAGKQNQSRATAFQAQPGGTSVTGILQESRSNGDASAPPVRACQGPEFVVVAEALDL